MFDKNELKKRYELIQKKLESNNKNEELNNKTKEQPKEIDNKQKNNSLYKNTNSTSSIKQNINLFNSTNANNSNIKKNSNEINTKIQNNSRTSFNIKDNINDRTSFNQKENIKSRKSINIQEMAKIFDTHNSINNNIKNPTSNPNPINKSKSNINNSVLATNQANKNNNNNNNLPKKEVNKSINNNVNNNLSQIKENITPKNVLNKSNINNESNKNGIKKTKSIDKIYRKNILDELNDITTKNNNKKSQSTKNKKCKINLDNNLVLNKLESKSSIYDVEEELDEVIQINDLENRRTTNEIGLPTRVKRTKTSGSEKKSIPIKKRHSILDENNCLTIKLKSKNEYTKDDFEVVTFSGKGAYGTVLQVYLKKDPKKKIYAIKKLDINSLFSVNRLYQAYLENDILNELDSPYIVKVYGAFESDGKIHLVMDFLPNGDFSYFIKTNFPLKEDIIKFYSAEIVLFLEYMQSKNLIHRDLKPQNIMIDEKGHLKVIDFGTVRKLKYYYDKREMRFKEEKVFERIDSEDIKGVKNIVNPDEEDADEDDYDDEDEEDEDNEDDNDFSEKKKRRIQKVRTKRSMTFVGTAEYISPEVIGDRPAEFGTDLWAFGVMLYQMYFNTTPFKAITTYLTFRNIEKPNITFPNEKISEQAKDLILKILVADPKKRLGGGDPGTQYDMAHLKKHPFFKNIKWNNLHNTTPPGIKEYKFYECKKKSIYKDNEKNEGPVDLFEFFNDKSRSSNLRTIKEGIIKKKSTWFHYEKRKIVLDSTPRIVLTSLNDDKYYREILLNKKCKVTLVENNCFDLKTPQKNYRFKGNNNDGNDWAGEIVDVINAYGKE